MRPRLVLCWVVIAVGGLGLAGRAEAATAGGPRRQLLHGDAAPPPTATATVIEAGFLIIEDRYVPPPYTVRVDSGRLHINEQTIAWPQWPPACFADVDRNGGIAAPADRKLRRLESCLRQNALLICQNDVSTAGVLVGQAVAIVDVLLDDSPHDVKVRRLLDVGPSCLSAGQWDSLVETFEADANLAARVHRLKQDHGHGVETGDASLTRAFVSALTFGGFALAVLALGTLLRYGGSAACRLTGPQMVRLIGLIVAMNVYDLVCTLSANSLGDMWELNPFAAGMVGHVPTVVTFKLAVTAGAAIVFLTARYHRWVQTGSWWIGVVYTVLILRWATYNSLVMPC